MRNVGIFGHGRSDQPEAMSHPVRAMKGGARAALEDNHMADKSITKTELVASIARACTLAAATAVSTGPDRAVSSVSCACAPSAS